MDPGGVVGGVRWDERDENGERLVLPTLPPEVKLRILENLRKRDLASLRLVDKAWSGPASTLFEKKAPVNIYNAFLTPQFLLEVGSQRRTTRGSALKKEQQQKQSESEGEDKSDPKIRFKCFKILFDPKKATLGIPVGLSFTDFGEKVLQFLETRVEGGGGAVEGLTLDRLQGLRKERFAFFQQLFAKIPNVRKITFGFHGVVEPPTVRDKGGPHAHSLPVLEQVTTIVWYLYWNKVDLGPPFLLFAATPNVECLLNPVEGVLSSLNRHRGGYWPHLRSIGERGWNISSLLTVQRPLVRISLVDGEEALQMKNLVPLMEAYSNTLEVLWIQSGSVNVYENAKVDQYKYTTAGSFPIMPRLRSLSLLDARELRGAGFIFGDKLHPDYVQNPMRLDTHFPALETLEFTVSEYNQSPYPWAGRFGTPRITPQTCIWFLNFFPLLLEDDEGPSFPFVRRLTLNWPDPQEDFDCWKDWTRRVLTKFPRVTWNLHIDKWNVMVLNGDVEGGEGRVLVEWEQYETKQVNCNPSTMSGRRMEMAEDSSSSSDSSEDED